MKLEDKAMLASLNISVWSAKKHDKKISNEVAVTHQVQDADMGRYNKQLIAKKALEKLTQIAGAARKDFYTLSLPWRDDGSRIVTSAAFFKLSERMRHWQNEFQPAKEEFVAEYANYVEAAKKIWNGAFNQDDYPSVSEIANKFRIAFHVDPLPVADDFRVKLSDTETALIKQQITNSMQHTVNEAMNSVWKRMHKVVGSMAESLKEYRVNVGGKEVYNPKTGKTRTVYVENKFEDTLVTNIKDLLEIIPALNLTDNPDVTKFAAYMKQLTKYDANQLRDNDGTRLQVAKAAEDILSKMSAYV